MARGEARAAAMQLIYEAMLGGEGGEYTLTELLGFSPSGDDLDYIGRVTQGVREKMTEIDGRLEGFLVNWTMERLPRVDLSIMRLAAYEILFCEEVPNAVAVNEAVELSRQFSTEEAGGFINGVLGSMIRAGDIPG